MALSRVELTSEVFRTCVTHALTTESEEIMGLLLGDVLYDAGGAVARIWVAMPQIRTDRRKDRVEASPEQLAQASAVAEHFSEASNRRTRVIGWYHSHPHITVLPSHVDIRTQAMYQSMDEGFIGLIFSVFNQDGSDKTQKVQMTAFQSMQQGWDASMPPQRGSWDFDSPMAAAISASMAEARAAAAAEGQWVQRKVALAVVPASSTAEEATLRDLITLCRVLFEEEQHAFSKAVQAATDKAGMISPLTAIHQAAEYQQHLARLIELVAAPVLQSLQSAQAQAQLQQQQLRDLRDSLALRAAKAQQGGQYNLPPPPAHLGSTHQIQQQQKGNNHQSLMDGNQPRQPVLSSSNPSKAAARASVAWPAPPQQQLERASTHSEASTSQQSSAAFPDLTAAPTTVDIAQAEAHSRDPTALRVVFTDWVRDSPNSPDRKPLKWEGSSNSREPYNSKAGRNLGQQLDKLGRSPEQRKQSAVGHTAPGSDTASSGRAQFTWTGHTNWDDDSPVAATSLQQGAPAISGSKPISTEGLAAAAQMFDDLDPKQLSTGSLPSGQSAAVSAGAGSVQSLRQQDPFDDLLLHDMAGFSLSGNRAQH